MNLQEFSIVRSYCEKIKEDNELTKMSDAFYYLVLESILDISENEIVESITDNSFLTARHEEGGHDRGIDAIYIENDTKPIIHFFNCKYTEKFNVANDSNFPSGEIDKIAQYFEAMMTEDRETISASNHMIKEKTEEVWEIFKEKSPTFVLHFCANFAKGLQPEEEERLKRILSKYSSFGYKFHGIDEFVQGIASADKKILNGKFRIDSESLFERSDGDIRALILSVNALDLLRMISDDESLRENIDAEAELMFCANICEDAFNDNVRIYQSQKNRINKSIANTALSETEHAKFFYYNNGITITCSSFSYPRGPKFPIVELKNLQIVNGSQTLHALYEAMKQNQENVDRLANVELLCRIYELKEPQYSSRIAEYTNSQNPVTTRDIRSIDVVQQNLEAEFRTKGFYYERKKNQHQDQPKRKRIDASLAGQVLMAFYNEMPTEAKNDKKLIFGEKYDQVFDEDMTAEKVLLAYELFIKIENEKKEYIKQKAELGNKEAERKSYLPYVSFFVLYAMKLVAKTKKIELTFANLSSIFGNYSIAIALIEKAIDQEKKYGESYSNSAFFKSARPKAYITDYVRRCGDDISEERVKKVRLQQIKK